MVIGKQSRNDYLSLCHGILSPYSLLISSLSQRKRVKIALLVSFLRSLYVSGYFIIVAPLSLVPNWVKTFTQYTNLAVSCLAGTQEERETIYSGRLDTSLYGPNTRTNAQYPVIITSYEEAISESQQLKKIGEFKYFVMDEGEGFERYRSILLSSLKHNRSAYRLFLPTSPMNRAKDMLTLVHFNLPRLLDHDALLSFIQYTEQCNEEERHRIETKLQAILRAFTVHGV